MTYGNAEVVGRSVRAELCDYLTHTRECPGLGWTGKTLDGVVEGEVRSEKGQKCIFYQCDDGLACGGERGTPKEELLRSAEASVDHPTVPKRSRWQDLGIISDNSKMASSTRYEQGIPLAVRKISKKVRVVTQGQNRWKGLVRDLSLKGLRAASPKRPSFRGGQVLQLEINTDVIGESDPIIADAKCDWIKKKGNRIRYFVVGFYLTDIGAETKGRLEKLIRALLGQPQQSIGTETSIIQIHEVLFKDDLGEGFNQLDFELTHELVLSDERPGLPHSKEEASSDSIAGDSDKSSET